MNFSTLKSLAIPQGEVAKIEVNGVILWQKAPSIKNWAKYSINEDGTIYNNGLGYKDNYRIRSGGIETSSSYMTCTGFIPLKKGETLYIYPSFAGFNTQNAINLADASFNNLGQFTDDGTRYGICKDDATYKATTENGITSFTLTDKHNGSADVAYVRVTNDIGSATPITSGAEMIITVNQEIN